MVPCPKRQRPNEVQAMFFGFQLTCGLMMVFYGYSVMKNPRVWGDQGRRAETPRDYFATLDFLPLMKPLFED